MENESEENQDSGHEKERGKRSHRGEPRQNAMYLKREIHFTIEAPNGDQIPMRYKPEMNVEMLFQHACKKFNISAEEHYMIFNNKEMEAQDYLRNHQINQNSILKIYKGKKVSTSSDIFVSVRIRDCRIGSVFRMTDTLWDILYKLLSDQSYEADMVPIVIYLKQEFIGEEILKQVRLRDMGITQGSCVIRFLQLKQEDLDQRKMKEDEDTMATLESLELKAAGPTADAGLRSVKFRISEDELDSENIQFIGERKSLAFRLPDSEAVEDAVQECFFDLMTEEIAALFNEVGKRKGTNRKSELVDTVVVELEKLKDIRYDFDDTIVRIQFPDRTCLQFLFLPEERVADVKDFMRKFLKDPHEDYDLYVTDASNNKNILNDSSTFSELKMIPVARIYYEAKERRGMSVEQYLSDEIVLSLVPYNIAKEAALMLRGESLDRFLMTDGDRDSTMRKSTGGFLSKFVRSSHSSGRVGGSSRTYDGSRSYSKHYSKKQSSFQPRSWSRGSSAGQRRSGDDDDDDVEIATITNSGMAEKRALSRMESPPSQQVEGRSSRSQSIRRSVTINRPSQGGSRPSQSGSQSSRGRSDS